MRNINRVTLVGRLTRDPELKTVGAGNVCKFSLALSDDYKKDGAEVKRSYFIDCVSWGKGGEIIAQYVGKGQMLAVEGKLSQRTWDDSDGKKRSAVEVVVDGFQLLERKEKGEAPEAPQAPISDFDLIPF